MSGGLRRPVGEPPDSLARQDAERLAALARDCEAAGIHRRCLVLRLSLLPSDMTRPHHVRLAREALAPLLAADRAQGFGLPNRDLVVVWRGQAADALIDAEHAVRRLFADTPPDLLDPAQLCLVLDLPTDVDRLLDLLVASLAAADAESETPAEATSPMDAVALTRLENALARADVARFLRRGQVCALTAAGSFQLAWEERKLAVDELTAELLPDRAARSDPWLYSRLTRTLDRRTLTLLADPHELRGTGPFALDLNAASILAPEFLRFDAALPQGLRGQVALGLLPGDILADLPAFEFARDFAHARGYRLILRLGGADLLEVMPAERLGVDLVQLRWSRAMLSVDSTRIEAVAPHALLTGVDSEEAIGWGGVLGIRLFSGRAVSGGRMTATSVLTTTVPA
jgi:hypothetical protein